jgi:hypothetical protein
MALLRQVTENWLVCATCQKDENVRLHILTGKGKRLRYEQLAKSIGVENTIYADYKNQSKLAHGTYLSLGILKEKDASLIRILPTYEKILFLYCSEAYIKYSILMLDCMYKLLTSIDSNKANEWDKQRSEITLRIKQWQKNIRDKYGEQLKHNTDTPSK